MSTSTYTTSQAFNSAVAYLSSYKGSTSNSTKLEIYSLFKYVTISPTPNVPKPGIFDIAGKAKWSAWAEAGKKYQRPEDAEARYITIAKELGWNESQVDSIPQGTSSATKDTGRTSTSTTGEEGEESIWDENPEPRRAGAGQGLGVGVSSISRSEDDTTTGGGGESSLHSVILDGDVTKVKELIERNPGLNLNAADEYGYTPLHLASDRGHLEVVKLLLDKGADKSIKDPDDFTPKSLAEIAGNKEIADLL
ncbi:ankyrin repeat-containing domain protein [Coprinopsis sp. MPI-PUGE-AT-0042]|nr:ankyrin repeat-containing domain protein [Coprinopsis sp. MPI-PUGE-AT-0042]